MPALRHLSPEWVEALDASVASSVFAPDVQLVIEHVIDDVAYHVAIEDQRATVRPGRAEHPTVTFTEDRATAADIAAGRLSAQQAFTDGRLRVRGDLTVLNDHASVLAALDEAWQPVRRETEL
jgi:alkyl sulfatase BDS1-like metallo-beta-lactamase superfamily hydrolase